MSTKESNLFPIMDGRERNAARIAALGEDLEDGEKEFIEFYLQVWNVQKAAVMAGCVSPDASITEQRAVGNKLYRKPDIAMIITSRLNDAVMSSTEVLGRLSAQARFDVTVLLKEVEGGRMEWDWMAIKSYGHLIKKMKQTRYGLEIEPYSAQDALNLMGKHHRLFAEVHHVDGTITVEAVQAWKEHAGEQTIDVLSLPDYKEEEQRDQIDIITLDKKDVTDATENSKS